MIEIDNPSTVTWKLEGKDMPLKIMNKFFFIGGR